MLGLRVTLNDQRTITASSRDSKCFGINVTVLRNFQGKHLISCFMSGVKSSNGEREQL